MNMANETNNNNEAIVLNRMFTGDYLEENIGHEVINLFKSDNGKCYLYLNALGSFHSDWKGRIKSMLMVRTIQGAKMLEVIGLATGLKDVYKPELAEKAPTSSKKPSKDKEEKYSRPTLKKDQDDFIAANDIKYDGVSLNKIFSSNRFQQDVNITFETERVVKPKKPIYITFETDTTAQERLIGDNMLVKLTRLNAAKASLKQYIANRGTAANAYSVLSSLINNADLWDEGVGTVAESKAELEHTATETMFDICGIAYSELAYSNAIAYFFERYPHLFTGFMHELGVDFPINGRFDVKRELLNIDLLFTNGEKSIVIENKIKSGINGLDKHDPNKSQLEKYYRLLVEEESKGGKLGKVSDKATIKGLRRRFPNPQFFVLTPDYNNVDLSQYECGNKYTKIHYSQLYAYLKTTEEYKNNRDYQFHEYVDSLERHASPYDNELYVTTLQRFMDMIKESKA